MCVLLTELERYQYSLFNRLGFSEEELAEFCYRLFKHDVELPEFCARVGR